MAVRELSRELNLPYETVRRHVRDLEQSGACVVKTVARVAPPCTRSTCAHTMLRKIYVNAVRLLVDLTRIGAVAFPSASRRLPPQGVLRRSNGHRCRRNGPAAGRRAAMRDFWGGNLLKGLVFTAIWTANVKHVTNTSRPPPHRCCPTICANRSASSPSPGRCVCPMRPSGGTPNARAGRPVRACREPGRFRANHVAEGTVAGSVAGHRLVIEFLAELRQGGVRL